MSTRIRYLFVALSILFVHILQQPVQADPMLDAHWTFDSDFQDSTGNGHHGSAINQAAITNTVGDFMVGSGGLTLDSSGDFVNMNVDSYKGITGTGARTVSAWIKTGETGGGRDQTIISWGTDSGSQKWIYRMQTGNGQAGATRVEVNGGYIVGNAVLNDDQWHHVALTFEDDGTPNVRDVMLYVDGVLDAQFGGTTTPSASQSKSINTASGSNVRIGRGHSNRDWGGQMDDVGIFASALSPQEVSAIPSLALNSNLGYDLSDAAELFELNDNQTGSIEIGDFGVCRWSRHGQHGPSRRRLFRLPVRLAVGRCWWRRRSDCPCARTVDLRPGRSRPAGNGMVRPTTEKLGCFSEIGSKEIDKAGDKPPAFLYWACGFRESRRG